MPLASCLHSSAPCSTILASWLTSTTVWRALRMSWLSCCSCSRAASLPSPGGWLSSMDCLHSSCTGQVSERPTSASYSCSQQGAAPWGCPTCTSLQLTVLMFACAQKLGSQLPGDAANLQEEFLRQLAQLRLQHNRTSPVVQREVCTAGQLPSDHRRGSACQLSVQAAPGIAAMRFSSTPAGTGSCCFSGLAWEAQMVKQKRSLCEGSTLQVALAQQSKRPGQQAC